MQMNKTITSRPAAEEMPRVKVTAEDIRRTREAHILRNLLYSPKEAAQLLNVSPRTILERVREGKLDAVDDSGKASAGIKITAESIERYRQSITLPVETWQK